MSNKYDAFLKSVSHKYHYFDTMRKHIKACMSVYKDLRIKDEDFVFYNGETRNIIFIYGTIHVPYKGINYNIPIGLYLNFLYPEHPPMAYVKPTSYMSIKTSSFLDIDGRVYLPMLSNWNKKKDNLLGLIKKLISIFSESMPVFLKTQNSQSPSANMNLSYPINGASTGYPIQGATPTPAVPNNYSNNYNTSLSMEQIRISLLSAVKDKLQRKVQEIYYQSQAELQTLRRTQTELETGKNNIHDIIKKMEDEQEQVTQNIALMDSKNEEMLKIIEQMEGKSGVDVDEAVIPIAPIYKQLITAYSEEQAIDDTLYCLSEALRKNVIDVDVFLKKTRELSRKQFGLKEIVTKCRLTSGLPSI